MFKVADRKRAIIRRRIFPALSVLSLLLCVATLALWVRSYWRRDIVSYAQDRGDTLRSLVSQSVLGEIVVTVAASSMPPSRRQAGWRFRSRVADPSEVF